MVEDLIVQLLAALGEDPGREGLERTPDRVARSLEFLTSGYRVDPQEVLARGVFSADEVSDEMVVVKDIEIYSLCEHHMLPFYGKAHIAYLPKRRIVGLSKLARLVDVFSRRLQVQERLTIQIAEALVEALDPMGVGVIVEAAHLCMMMRGVQKQNSVTVTSCVRGRFKSDARTRAEFMRLSGC